MSATSKVQILNEEATVGPDTNANMSGEPSKGAIPKKARSPTQKRPGQQPKLNNNIENMSTMNCGDDAPKTNGLNYLDLNVSAELIQPSCSSYNTFAATYDDSSSDDNDLLSVSDDGCIYTYKGDNVADLPSSFFSLDIPPDIPEPAPSRNQTSSPEMDYLEMDFDPGNNGDPDSYSENAVERVEPVVEPPPVLLTDLVEVVQQPVQVVEVKPGCSWDDDGGGAESRVVASGGRLGCRGGEQCKLPGSRYPKKLGKPVVKTPKTPERPVNINPLQNEEVMPWSCTLAQRTKSINFRVTKRCHCTRGELVSPNENVPQIKGASVPTQLADNSQARESIESVMIWSKEEAHLKQITQIGPSACGATAVLNVLNALRFPIPSVEKIKECVSTRLRRNDSPLSDYLQSRSTAGTTHEDLIEGLHRVSNGSIYARFFHMYPEKIVNLYSWLGFWIRNGAVPIATLNLQRCLGTVPDAWHHQMIYGIDSEGIYLSNPLECVEPGLLWPQLCSESVLLVRREDVLSRWNFRTDLPALMQITDVRWRRINVVGQVANMIHESGRELRPGFTNTSHIRIPASYSSGITLATSVTSPACDLLRQSPELPLLDPSNAAYF